MDILKQYKKEHPMMFREVPQEFRSRDHRFLIALVIWMSGGRVRDTRDASVILIVAALAVAALTIVVVFFNFGRSIFGPRASDFNPQQQLEEYRKIQPF